MTYEKKLKSVIRVLANLTAIFTFMNEEVITLTYLVRKVCRYECPRNED